MGVIPTFRDVLANEGLASQDLTVGQTDAVWSEYDRVIRERVQELRRSPDLSGSLGALNHILAEETIAAHLGTEWVEKNVIDPSSSNQAQKYLSHGDHRLHTRRGHCIASKSWRDASTSYRASLGSTSCLMACGPVS